jgi:hypothetical protein
VHFVGLKYEIKENMQYEKHKNYQTHFQEIIKHGIVNIWSPNCATSNSEPRVTADTLKTIG